MSYDNWVIRTLGEITNNYDKKRVPLSTMERVSRKGKYPYYGAQGIIDYIDNYIFEGRYLLIAEDGANLQTRNQDIALLTGVKDKFWVNNHAHILDSNELSDIRYIKYYLNHYDISGYITGSAQPKLNQSNLHNIEINLPTIEEQKAIANILSSLDDKIELNNKINKNLEELAQTLYKQWFVDFEFPNEDGEPYKSSGGEMVESELGKIPMDWSIKSIGDYSTVKSGYAFKSDWWSNKGLGVVKIKDLNDITINENNLDRVDHSYATKAMEFSVNFGDILIAMTGATLGKIGIVSSKHSNLYVNQRVGKFFLGEHPIKKLPFLHNLLRNKEILEEIVRRGSGSAQSNISPSDIMSIKIPYNKEVINSFNIIFEHIYIIYLNNLEQNKILSKTRDELLPKLMNGEIEVPIEE